jgi:hypothetical protein
VTRKKLKIEEKAHHFSCCLHPFLADRWERLSFEEYWALKLGEKVYVLLDPLIIREAVFHPASPLAASVMSICEGRPTMGHFHYPDNREQEGWLIWIRFHNQKSNEILATPNPRGTGCFNFLSHARFMRPSREEFWQHKREPLRLRTKTEGVPTRFLRGHSVRQIILRDPLGMSPVLQEEGHSDRYRLRRGPDPSCADNRATA